MVSGHWGHRGLRPVPQNDDGARTKAQVACFRPGPKAVLFTSSLCSTITWLGPSGVG